MEASTTSDKQRLTDDINRVERVVKRGLREEYIAEWTNTAHAVFENMRPLVLEEVIEQVLSTVAEQQSALGTLGRLFRRFRRRKIGAHIKEMNSLTFGQKHLLDAKRLIDFATPLVCGKQQLKSSHLLGPGELEALSSYSRTSVAVHDIGTMSERLCRRVVEAQTAVAAAPRSTMRPGLLRYVTLSREL